MNTFVSEPTELKPAKIDKTTAVGVPPSFTERTDYYEFALRPLTAGKYLFMFFGREDKCDWISVHDTRFPDDTASWANRHFVRLTELEKMGRWVSQVSGPIYITSL